MWTWYNHKGLYEREAVRLRVSNGYVMMWCWLWKWRTAPWGEEGRWPLEAGKVRESDASLEPPEWPSQADALALALWGWFGTSDLQKSKLSSFTPLNFGSSLQQQLEINKVTMIRSPPQLSWPNFSYLSPKGCWLCCSVILYQGRYNWTHYELLHSGIISKGFQTL